MGIILIEWVIIDINRFDSTPLLSSIQITSFLEIIIKSIWYTTAHKLYVPVVRSRILPPSEFYILLRVNSHFDNTYY